MGGLYSGSGQVSPTPTLIKYERHEIALGTAYFHLQYHELFTMNDFQTLFPRIAGFVGEPKSMEYGEVIGIALGYTLTLAPLPLSVESGSTFLAGLNNTYDGAIYTESSTHDTLTFTPATGTKNNFFWFNRLIVLYHLHLPRVTLDLGTGATYSRWDRELFSMSETYKWFTIPLTVRGSLLVNQHIVSSLNLTFAPMINGTMSIEQALPAGHAFRADPVTLGNEYAYHAEWMLRIRLNRLTGVKLGPSLNGHRFGKSGIKAMTETDENGTIIMKGTYFEPASETDNLGFSLMITLFTGAAVR